MANDRPETKKPAYVAGFSAAPIQPTQAMIKAGASALLSASDALAAVDVWFLAEVAYKAMLQSAPARIPQTEPFQGAVVHPVHEAIGLKTPLSGLTPFEYRALRLAAFLT
jgi:hypothetical protein